MTNDPEAASMGFEDWKKILDDAEERSDFEKHAATMTVAKAPADDPDKLVELLKYSVIDDDSDLREKVFEKLRATMPTLFTDWKDIYESTENNEVKEIARDKMVDGADSVDRLIEIHDTVDDDAQADDEFQKKFTAKAKEILKTEEDCRRIVENYTAESVLFTSAFQQLLGLASTTRGYFDLIVALMEDWKTEDDYINDDLLDETIDKLLSVATQNEIYIMSKLGDDFSDLVEKAEEKLNAQS